MTAMSGNPEVIARMIHEARTIAVCSHVNPDGDTLGCAAAMQHALNYLGKDVSLFCDGKVPDQLSFLPGIGKMSVPTGAEGPFDLLLSVDVSDEKRLGACALLKEKCQHTAQIDHHRSLHFQRCQGIHIRLSRRIFHRTQPGCRHRDHR